MSENKSRQKAADQLIRLMELISRLRAPNGCPWDRKQTPKSSAKYLVEESYEAVEAIKSDNIQEIKEELGDVLFQVVFQSQLFSEKNDFDLSGVIEYVHDKMKRRHPHVFGENKLNDPEKVRELWGEIKQKERKANGQGLLDSLPQSAPALSRSFRLGERTAQIGFDWPNSQQVWEKVQEEMDELKKAQTQETTFEELGDVFFSLAQWARHKGFDPEACLAKANEKFTDRFKAMESLAKEKGLDLAKLNINQMDELWEKIKSSSTCGDNHK